ncbi:MAG: hypothetical protein ACQEW5_16815 [Bacillota bacterium]
MDYIERAFFGVGNIVVEIDRLSDAPRVFYTCKHLLEFFESHY